VGGTVLIVSKFLSRTQGRMRVHNGKVNDELLSLRVDSEGNGFIVL